MIPTAYYTKRSEKLVTSLGDQALEGVRELSDSVCSAKRFGDNSFVTSFLEALEEGAMFAAVPNPTTDALPIIGGIVWMRPLVELHSDHLALSTQFCAACWCLSVGLMFRRTMAEEF